MSFEHGTENTHELKGKMVVTFFHGITSDFLSGIMIILVIMEGEMCC